MTQPVSTLVATIMVGGVEYTARTVGITLDESWSPYAAALVTLPYDAALTAALDPRTSPPPRVLVRVQRQWFASLTLADLSTAWAGLTLANLSTAWTGLTLADLSDQWSTPWDSGLRAPDDLSANLCVRGLDADIAEDTITLRLTSDELRAQDYTIGGIQLPQEPLSDRLLRLLSLAGIYPTAYDFTAGAPFIAVPPEVTSWSETTWAAMARTVNSLGLRVWCDVDQTWRLTVADAVPTTTVSLNRVTTARDTIDRDGDYADAMVWNGRGTQADGTVLTDSRQWPAVIPAGSKVAVVNMDYGADVGAALPMPTDDELEARVAKLASQARVLSLSGPADPSLRPGFAMNTGTPSLPTTASVIATVAIQIPADRMTITTRATV